MVKIIKIKINLVNVKSVKSISWIFEEIPFKTNNYMDTRDSACHQSVGPYSFADYSVLSIDI